MRIIEEHLDAGVTAASIEITSLTDPSHTEMIENDVDEELWEDFETGVRHVTAVTPNFLVLMTLGGCIAAVGLFEHGAAQAIAFVAASIIAPGFEPLAIAPAGVILRSLPVAKRALESFLAGYAALLAGAGAMYWIMHAMGKASMTELLSNPDVRAIMQNAAAQNTISLCAALAGIVMLTAYRAKVIAGPLIALALIPSAALTGVSIAALHGEALRLGAVRFALDVGIVLVISATWIALKQHTVHRRRPML